MKIELTMTELLLIIDMIKNGTEQDNEGSCSHNPDKQPKVQTMAKRLTKQEKWNKASEDLINKMFEIAGHNVTYDDIKGRTDDWYTDWTMTIAQAEQWKEWGMEYLRKNMKLNKKLADIEMRMFNVMYGLKYSDWFDGTDKENTHTSRAVSQGSVQPQRM
jgi:hypothetical protein